MKEPLVSKKKKAELRREAVHLPSWNLTQRQVWDIELLLNGAFSPLNGFLRQADFHSVCNHMRLQNGTLWPIPITLDVNEKFAVSLDPGDRVALRHPEGMVLAILTVQDKWYADHQNEAQLVYGTTNETHPGVSYLFHQTYPIYLGGYLEGMEHPPHHAFHHLHHTPTELRNEFKKLGWQKVVAFQPQNPMHRAHVQLTKQTAMQTEANLLLHPAVGCISADDVDYFTRVRCYQKVLKHYPKQTAMLSLLPLAMRMAGPREALWHAIIRKNYGCTHLMVGMDHADPGKNGDGKAFYDSYDAQELVTKHEDEIGIKMVAFEEMVYVRDSGQYLLRSAVQKGSKTLSLSGIEFHRRLHEGLEIPSWFSYPEVIAELRKSFPPRKDLGFTVFFTGLPSSGKSTIAKVLMTKLMEMGQRPVTLLDGDIVRKNLSSELGFSKEHRDLNILRIGYVAGEITKSRGVAICAPIAPYAAIRQQIREKISRYGGFIEVYVATSLEVCEQRDRKGLYAMARAGLIKNFTGIDDPYEAPKNPDVFVDTTSINADQAAQQILLYLEKQNYIEKS